METSSPDHTYLTVGDRYLASLQLFYVLIGTYNFKRKTPTSLCINNKVYSPSCFKYPLRGITTIDLRASTSPLHEVELIQTTSIPFHDLYGQRMFTTVERRAIRFSNGEWIVWRVHEEYPGGKMIVQQKVADLVFPAEVPFPKYIGGHASDVYQSIVLETKLDTATGEAGGDSISMTYWLGPKPVMQIRWKDQGKKEVNDEFWPVRK